MGVSQTAQLVTVRALTSVQVWHVHYLVGTGGFSYSITMVPPKTKSIAASRDALLHCINAFLIILGSKPI